MQTSNGEIPSCINEKVLQEWTMFHIASVDLNLLIHDFHEIEQWYEEFWVSLGKSEQVN